MDHVQLQVIRAFVTINISAQYANTLKAVCATGIYTFHLVLIFALF